MNSRQIAIATMTMAFAASMASAHLPSADQAMRQMGRPFTGDITPNNSRALSFTFSKIPEWDEKTEGYIIKTALGVSEDIFFVKHGKFKETTQYWRGNWYPDAGDEPGEFADSGGTSAYGLVNSLAFSKDGSDYKWVGWNSGAGKYTTESDGTDYGLVDKQNGDWGDQIDKKGAGAYIPTWRDGAEGAYTMIHDDIGAMNFQKSVQPANEVGYNHPRIRVGWGVFVRDMDSKDGNPADEGEWEGARKMVMDGHEMLNHSWDHTSAADQWQWANGPKPSDLKGEWKNDTLSIDDPALPAPLRGLIVGAPTDTYGKKITFKVKYTRYEGDDVTKPITLETADQSYEVSSDYATHTRYRVNTPDTTYDTEDEVDEAAINSADGWVDTIPYATGKIKPNSTTWYENGTPNGGKGPIVKIFCVPGWKDDKYDMYKANIALAKTKMDEEVYGKVKSPRHPDGKMTEYYVYPYDAYSKLTHDKLKEAGIIAARGGAKSGFALPGDFYQPFRIDFDAFFMMDEKASLTLSAGGNPHQRLGLQELVERVIKTKGYMIREFHACADVSYWDDANLQSKGGWWGGIPKSLYETHFSWLDQQIDAHKVVVFTPTEAVKYRLTANSATKATISGKEVTVTATGCPKEYQDEISVIVKFASKTEVNSCAYSDGSEPRYKPVAMNSEKTAYSISVNPYKLGGKVTLSEVVSIPTAATKANAIAFKGFNPNGQIALSLPAGTYTAELYNVSGRQIASTSVVGTNGIVTTGLNTSNIGSGVFFLNVKSNGASVMQQKLMIK